MLKGVSIVTQRWALRRLDRLSERLGRLRGRPAHLLVGERGEREAWLHLRAERFLVVARRWTTGRLRGDLDLIAWEGDVLCFVEVKTRAERNVMDPAESAVDEDKRRMLRKMANAYLRGFAEKERRGVVTRFDVLAVYLGSASLKRSGAGEDAGVAFELFRGAFGWH